ncbi:MAG: hypothetical protein JKY94_05500 [Rhodobacteraceae bacterium]|nr:hypothetical protein [Paracoccaceae bacterium]
MSGLKKFIGVGLALLMAWPVWSAELIMVEEDGCMWCARWNAEIAPIYPKTAEGAFAPLRWVEIHAIPADINVKRPVNFTPTFLIVQDGQELTRIEGYPGEDWFWPILARLLQENTEFTGENG